MKLVDFWDGQPLRYVLKHRNVAKGIDQELFVITFTLIPKEELEKEKERWEGGGGGGGSGGGGLGGHNGGDNKAVEVKEKEKSQKESKAQKQQGFQDDDVD